MSQPGHNWTISVPEFSASYSAWIQRSNAEVVPRLLFHDLRRSAVRNMMQTGVQQAVAMKISGHSSPQIFQRYNIIDESDLHEAVKKVEDHKG